MFLAVASVVYRRGFGGWCLPGPAVSALDAVVEPGGAFALLRLALRRSLSRQRV